jgi:GMP synthase (glutamine-hydrolysing)
MVALIVLHHEADSPGAIARELRARGVGLREVRGYRGDPIPTTIGDASALVVMGGPMSVDDERAHPSLALEKRLIALGLEARIPVLGVCLGAQLLASVLGGRVARADAREIGWHEVHREANDPLFDRLPRRFTTFHWHGDAIALPPGATLLARSAATEVQAFRFGAAHGVQFHLESDAEMIEALSSSFASDLRDEHIDPHALASATRAHIEEQETLAGRFFGGWADELVGETSLPLRA